MTPSPEPWKTLAQHLLDVRDRLAKAAARGLQAYFAREERQRERRDRRFARQDWVWLVCMILLAGLMVLELRERHREVVPNLALLFSFCLVAYLMARHARRQVAARDEATRKDR